MTKSTIRRIETLNYTAKTLAKELIKRGNKWLKENGWEEYTIEVSEGKRTNYIQAGYYSIGRKFDRKKKKWVNLPKEKRITWTLDSNHLDGNAFDIYLLKKGRAYWPSEKIKRNLNMWLALARIGGSLGLFPGAFWRRKKDYPHYSTVPG